MQHVALFTLNDSDTMVSQRRTSILWSVVLTVLLVWTADPAVAQDDSEGEWTSIFNGENLDGWHLSAESSHSSASDHESAGEWTVRDGAIWGRQDMPGNGGLLITDQEYEDVEIRLEMRNDYGPDSGIFLRSTEDGVAYQVNIDYRDGGTLGGIYGEGLDADPNIENFRFDGGPEQIIAWDAPTPLPVLPESWTYFWDHHEWQEIRARIEGNPPTVTSWVNGVKFMVYTDDELRHQDSGGIALQVHGGTSVPSGDLDGWVRYRNIQVRELD